jgi:PAS domain S-box-containing protein
VSAFRELVDDLREIVFRTDAQGLWTFLNAAWQETTGYSVPATIGKPFLDFVHSGDRAENRERFRPLVEGRKDYCRHEVRYLTAAGGYCWVEVHARAIRDRAGQLVGTSGTISNIHDRHAAEEALRRREVVLEAVSYAARRFLHGEDWEAAIPEVLERLGPAAEADYAGVLDRVGGPRGRFLVRQRHMWLRDRDLGAMGPGSEPVPAIAAWEKALERGEVVAGAAASFPPAERALLERSGVRQIAVFPVLVDQAVWGNLSLARAREAPWSPALLDGLRVAAEIIGAAIQQSRSRETLRLAHAELEKRVEARTSELGEANRALRESERLYRTLVETSPEAIALTDPRGRVTMVNRSSVELFGYPSAADMLGSEIGPVLRNEDPERVQTVREELLSTGRLRDVELRLTRRSGTVFDAEVNATVVRDAAGAPEYTVRMARDISGRKAVERELLRSEQWFRAIFDEAPIAMAITDADVRIRAANHRFQEMLERSAVELADTHFREFTHPDDWADSERAVNALRFVGTPAQVLDKRYLTKSGRVVWARSTVANLLSLGEHFMVFMVEDVTARKQLEEEFRQSQKMEAVGRLAGGIAHDFNNVLTVIKGYGELLQKRVAADEPATRKVAQIVKAAERAALLVGQLLAFSRKQAIEPKRLDVNGALREMHGMLRRLLREDIELSTRLDPATGGICADPGQFAQLLMNLAVNARDAMASGGHLEIATRVEEPTAEGGVPSPGRYAVIEVADTGCGMRPDVLSHIFEPFFTTKEIGKGTGLGLSTVYGIAHQAGGHIAVESAPGAGTTFRMYFPRVDDDRPAEIESAGPKPEDGSETILLTEDERAVREIAAEMLRDRGYTVLEAGDGREALDLAARHRRIHLLLSDVIMPQMGGLELWERIRELSPATRVLFLTGHTTTAIESGPALLPKPFSAEELAAKVREVLDAPAAARPSGQ